MINKSRGNMYSFVDKTRNFLGGECEHKCQYCYVNSLKNKFPNIMERYSGEIRLLEKELTKNEGEGKVIFVQDMGDLFAENVPHEMILKILEHLRQYPGNTYLFQTKNPLRFEEFAGVFPEKSIFGTTLETNRDNDLSNAPWRDVRAAWMCSLFLLDKRKFITIEPLMDLDLNVLVSWIKRIKPEFVNIGADSKNSNLPEPSKEKIEMLITELKKFTKVNIKDNLNRLME